MNIALHAPSDCRRSKKRLAAYEQKHKELRQEVELMRQSDEIDRLFLAAFEIEMEDPDQFRRIAEAW